MWFISSICILIKWLSITSATNFKLEGHPVHKLTKRSKAAMMVGDELHTGVGWFISISLVCLYLYIIHDEGNRKSSRRSLTRLILNEGLLPISAFLSGVMNETKSLHIRRCPSSNGSEHPVTPLVLTLFKTSFSHLISLFSKVSAELY